MDSLEVERKRLNHWDPWERKTKKEGKMEECLLKVS